MQVATIDGFLDTVLNVVNAGCAVAGSLPSTSPYQTGVKNACAAVPRPTTTAPATSTTSTASTMLDPRVSAQMQQQAAAFQQQAAAAQAAAAQQNLTALMARQAAEQATAVPWYKNWKVWAGVGGGVVALTAVGLVLRR